MAVFHLVIQGKTCIICQLPTAHARLKTAVYRPDLIDKCRFATAF
jgi:hypothetical protein